MLHFMEINKNVLKLLMELRKYVLFYIHVTCKLRMPYGFFYPTFSQLTEILENALCLCCENKEPRKWSGNLDDVNLGNV